MFNSKAKVASEAHSVTLAIEGLLGVVFTVATLIDEAVDVGKIESPRCDSELSEKCPGKTIALCIAIVDSMWLIILDALSLILEKSQGEAIVLEILKGYQVFTQACGVLRVVEPLNSFLASLCKFTINMPSEVEKKSVVQSPGTRSEIVVDQRESIVLTPKNVHALRTLFNIAHRLHNFLGPSWVLDQGYTKDESKREGNYCHASETEVDKNEGAIGSYQATLMDDQVIDQGYSKDESKREGNYCHAGETEVEKNEGAIGPYETTLMDDQVIDQDCVEDRRLDRANFSLDAETKRKTDNGVIGCCETINMHGEVINLGCVEGQRSEEGNFCHVAKLNFRKMMV